MAFGDAKIDDMTHPRRDIDQLVRDMTLDEKARLTSGATLWSTVAIERVGIPSVVVTDGSNNIVDYVADITLAANDYFLATGWVEHSPGAGSITYKLRARTNAGTVDILNSQLTGRILVEDIGT